MMDLTKLATETRNPKTMNLDELSPDCSTVSNFKEATTLKQRMWHLFRIVAL